MCQYHCLDGIRMTRINLKKKQLCLHMQFLMIFNNFLKLHVHVGDYLECGKPPV